MKTLINTPFLLIIKNIVAAQLKERYLKGIIYTYVGDILVSINPFHEMPELYSEEVVIMVTISEAIYVNHIPLQVSMKYINVPRGYLDPHIFAIADGAYQGMISENRNQVATQTTVSIKLKPAH